MLRPCATSGSTLIGHFKATTTDDEISDFGESAGDSLRGVSSTSSADYDARTISFVLCSDAREADVDELREELEDSGLIEKIELDER